MKITFITVSAPAVEQLIKAEKKICLKYIGALDLSIYYAVTEFSNNKNRKMIKDIKESDLVFVDLMGTPSSVVKAVYTGLEGCTGNIVPYGGSGREYMKLGKFTMESMSSKNKDNVNMESMRKMQNMAEKMGKALPGKMRDMRNYSLIMKYFKVANFNNMYNMLLLFLKEYGKINGIKRIEEPLEVKSISICDPEGMKFYENYDKYCEDNCYNVVKPIVAMLFYAHIYPTDTSKCISKIKKRFEKFANVLPIAISGTFAENQNKLKSFLLDSTHNKIDIILNFMSFRLGAGPMGGDFQAGLDILKEVNVPYMHPFFITRRTIEDWKNSIQGCSTSEIMISVLLPELDGCIDTIPIGAMSNPKYNERFDLDTEELDIIPERVERLAKRVENYIRLRHTKNKEKKIAIIGYNYPPGESNLFGGAFLDTFESIQNIVKHLNNNGYSVESLTKENLMNIFTAGKIVNSGKYGVNSEEMISYDIKNYNANHEVNKAWGEAPGTIMTEDNRFLIPGIINNNVFIGLQPSRGNYEDNEKSYHDKSIPPHHQYIAFYKWIKEEFNADVIIHVGTHGTLEFLKGKECGLSNKCYPDMLVSDIPHIYLYYCGNPSEATIAKRRSYANLVGYQPPVFVEGNLYGEYLNLSTQIDNYNQSLSISPQTSDDILKEIMRLANELNMPEDLEEIENELYRMNVSLVPKGLHVFGNNYTQEEANELAFGLIRYNRNGKRALCELVAEANDLDLNVVDNKIEADNHAKYLFDYYITEGRVPDLKYINEENKNEFLNTLSYAKDISKKVLENNEIKGLLKVLSGEYNGAKLAGDIYRNPNILPTGSNMYQFDPKLIPTDVAFERGKQICYATLESYKKEVNSYPKSTAVILWGLETSRTQGETFAQILSYLGVRIAKNSSVWDTKFEIIPINELGRPRIDVTVNICGFFRDMFPNLIESLNEIFTNINELKESDDENYFKANCKLLYRKLIDEGYDEYEAKELSVARIFGPKEGEYGTGITDIIGTKDWETENEIGNSFISSLRHVYSSHIRGRSIEGLYEENLKAVDIISQLRSNHEYEITDLDHYYEFFGGLSKSVEMVKGIKAKMYITDTTGEKIETEGVEKSIARGMRTRVLNPKWIDGMLEHKYHGVQKIADRFENIMGFAATTNSVEDWIYEDLNKNYIENTELRNRLIENNPHAYMKILEQMIEYSNRGYWNATDEQIEKIKEIYLEIEDNIEDIL